MSRRIIIDHDASAVNYPWSFSYVNGGYSDDYHLTIAERTLSFDPCLAEDRAEMLELITALQAAMLDGESRAAELANRGQG